MIRVVRALGLAVAFEARLLLRQLIPAFLLGTTIWVVLCAGLLGGSALLPSPELDRIVVVVEDPAWQEALDDQLAERFTDRLEDVALEVRRTAPEDGEADVEVWVPEDAARGAWRVVGADRATVERIVPIATLTQTWLRQQQALSDEERARLFDLEEAQDAVEDALDQADEQAIGRPRFWGSVVFVMALVFGVGSVRQNTFRRDHGLSNLLRIGTPRLALFLVEMLGGALMIGGIAFFVVVFGLTGTGGRAGALGWVPVALVALGSMWMQTGLVGVILGTVERERDQELHLDILLMPLGAIAAYLAWDLSGAALVALGVVPLFGMLAVCAADQPGVTTVALLGVQVAWGVVALERGAWVFGLAEPLRDALSRRLPGRRR